MSVASPNLEALGPGNPLTGRYLVKNPGWTIYLRCCDALLSAAIRRTSINPSRTPQRVLLAVGGHIGDAVISTATLSLLKREHPNLEIGVVAASWAAPIFDGHSDVSRVHVLDHWKFDRSSRPFATKIARHRRTLASALTEIRAARYEAAIDLYAYYPNMAWLMWRAGIPVRVGYRSGGYGPLYSHPVEWTTTKDHTAVQQARLAAIVFPSIDPRRANRYVLPPVRRDVARQTDEMLHGLGLSGGEFAVMHMGVGSSLREWPRDKWREVARALAASGLPLVLTGAGPSEIGNAGELARECACTNLAGRLSWTSFVHVISKARVVIAPETVAGHVAAAVGTPCVSLYTGMGNVDHWRPLSSDCSLLMHDVPCAPCYRRRGCDTMDCIRGITANEVISAAMREHPGGRATSDRPDLVAPHRGTA